MNKNKVVKLNFTEESCLRHPNDKKHKVDNFNPDHRTIDNDKDTILDIEEKNGNHLFDITNDFINEDNEKQ